MFQSTKRSLSIPVFIITCVVARLTFFLKPVYGQRKVRRLQQRNLPAQDMMAALLFSEEIDI
jgi:hypothetical protein